MNEETVIDKNLGNNDAQQNKVKSSNVVNEPNNLKSNSKKQETAAGNKQKATMGAAGVAGIAGAAGVAGAAIGMAIPFEGFSENKGDGNDEGTPGTGHGTSNGLVGHDMNVATNVDDSMSFSEAFAAAREEVGAGGIFVWHGNAYGTYYENEWNAMSPEDKNQYWADVHHTVQNNEYLQEHIHNEPSTAGMGSVGGSDPSNSTGNEGNNDDPNGGEEGNQQVNNGHGNEGNGVIPPDPPGGWEPDPATVPSNEPSNLGQGVSGNNQTPIHQPIPGWQPSIGPDGELILLPDEVIEELDTDGDGVVDMAIVNADGNDIPDVVLDTTGDGNFDLLAQDSIIDTETYDILPLGDVQDINGVHVRDEEGIPDPVDPEPPIVCGNPDLDPLASNIPDPNIPIDNNMNMGEFV